MCENTVYCSLRKRKGGMGEVGKEVGDGDEKRGEVEEEEEEGEVS